jgi:hypothetical protein
MAVLYENKGPSEWKLVGMTEVIEQSVDPKWKKSLDVPYIFEVH